MSLLDERLYLEDIKYVADLEYEWNVLEGKTLLLTGATGMIGSFLIDVIMYRNKKYGMNCKIIALGRNYEKAKMRFETYWEDICFKFINCDINDPIGEGICDAVDFIFHAASNTHPVAYATEPVQTITTNVIGTYNLLEWGIEHGMKKFLLASSVEIYGENRGDIEEFDESYMGYIDCNTLRAGYPESKRVSEALCQAYSMKYKCEIGIARIARVYGPTLQSSDTKALSQFLKKGIKKEDIVLKSNGEQFYSYVYVADVAAALLLILMSGQNGEAYNIADAYSNIRLKDLAKIIADYAGTKVIFEIPDEVEAMGYSKATKAIMDAKKIQSIGWKAHYSINEGLVRTIKIMEELEWR